MTYRDLIKELEKKGISLDTEVKFATIDDMKHDIKASEVSGVTKHCGENVLFGDI